MVFWIIEDGEKKGPLEDFELRELIRDGKVAAETRVWHEGADGWKEAAEINLLAGEFPKKIVIPPPIPLVIPPFLAWRRLGARVFDFFLYQLVLDSIIRMIGFSVIPGGGQAFSPWFMVWLLIPAILMEAALVSTLGHTPGKWLMALRVENHLGERLRTSHAIIRSLRVWVLGMGMRVPILLIFGHAVTLWFGLKRGAPLWDLHSGFRVMGSELEARRVVFYWLALVGVIALNLVVIWPEMEPFREDFMRQWEEAVRNQRK